MFRWSVCALVLCASIAAAQKDALTRARQLYNAAQYDAAITTVEDARRQPALANAAAVVLARAHLERYRQSGDVADLEAARQAIAQANASTLGPRDQVELTLAVAESLYFDDRFGAAAETFELALPRADLLGPGARGLVLDWWAGALDRQAQLSPETARRLSYARVLRRLEDELARDGNSPVAIFWLAASAAGADDGERALSAAQAGWVRAARTGAAGTKLRVDLDRLVRDVIIPVCAKARVPQGDPGLAVGAMRAAWEEFKAKWTQPSLAPYK